MKISDRYLKLVEWSDEDNCYIGSCPGIIGPSCHGDDELDVYRQICVIVDEWIEIYKEDGEPLPPATANKEYSGKFVLRVTPEIHKQLTISALKNDVSLNVYCTKKLTS